MANRLDQSMKLGAGGRVHTRAWGFIAEPMAPNFRMAIYVGVADPTSSPDEVRAIGRVAALRYSILLKQLGVIVWLAASILLLRGLVASGQTVSGYGELATFVLVAAVIFAVCSSCCPSS